MKRYIFTIAIIALCAHCAMAQFKIHADRRVSFQSLTTSGGVQIDSLGVTSFEPGLTASYAKLNMTKTNASMVKAWVLNNTSSLPNLSGDRFYVLGNGNVYSTHNYIIGNEPVTKGGQTIDNALEILSSLGGYYYPSHEFDGFEPDFEDNPNVAPDAIEGLMKDREIERDLGLDTEELEEVLPEAIRHDPQGKVFINYSALVPVLVEAVKAQQAEIDKLRAVLEEKGLLKP